MTPGQSSQSVAIAALSAKVDAMASENEKIHKTLYGNGQPGLLERLVNGLGAIDNLSKRLDDLSLEQTARFSEQASAIRAISGKIDDTNKSVQCISADVVSVKSDAILSKTELDKHSNDKEQHTYRMLLNKQALSIIFIALIVVESAVKYIASPIIKIVLASLGINIP